MCMTFVIRRGVDKQFGGWVGPRADRIMIETFKTGDYSTQWELGYDAL